MTLNTATLVWDDVSYRLRRDAWATVPELAVRLHLTRHVYRVQIAALMRQGVVDGKVEVRRRSQAERGTRGGGPMEYRRRQS